MKKTISEAVIPSLIALTMVTVVSGSAGADSLDLAGYCDMGEWGDEALYSVIFFEFTAAESATVEVSTCNQATFDTRLSVHADDCDPSSVITCMDDTDGCDGGIHPPAVDCQCL